MRRTHNGTLWVVFRVLHCDCEVGIVANVGHPLARHLGIDGGGQDTSEGTCRQNQPQWLSRSPASVALQQLAIIDDCTCKSWQKWHVFGRIVRWIHASSSPQSCWQCWQAGGLDACLTFRPICIYWTSEAFYCNMIVSTNTAHHPGTSALIVSDSLLGGTAHLLVTRS